LDSLYAYLLKNSEEIPGVIRDWLKAFLRLDAEMWMNDLGHSNFAYAIAESTYNRRLEICENTIGRENSEYMCVATQLGRIYFWLGKYEKAKFLLQEVLKIAERIDTLRQDFTSQILAYMGDLYEAQSQYAEAESCNVKAIQILKVKHTTDICDLLDAVVNLGEMYACKGDYVKVDSLCNDALDFFEENRVTQGTPDSPRLYDDYYLSRMASLCGLGRIYSKSLKCYERLLKSRVELMENAFANASETEKLHFAQRLSPINQASLSLTMIHPSPDWRSYALEMILNGKAVVVDALSAEKEMIYCSNNQRFQMEAAKLEDIRSDISSTVLAGLQEPLSDVSIDRLQILNTTKDSLEKELAKNCSEFRDELRTRRFTLSDIANNLQEGSSLWEFLQYRPYNYKNINYGSPRVPKLAAVYIGVDSVGKKSNIRFTNMYDPLGLEETSTFKVRFGLPRYLVLTLDHAGNTTLTDLGEAGEIDSLITQARKFIYEARTDVYSPLVVESERRLKEITGRLYTIIFAPLESHLSSKTDIFISPDGQLSLLPFEILPGPDGKYVVEKYHISYLSSGRDLLKFKKRYESTDQALVMVNPNFDLSKKTPAASNRANAPRTVNPPTFHYELSRGVSQCLGTPFNRINNTQEEAESIERTLNRIGEIRVESYCGDKAVEEVLKGIETPPRLLHLATHGYFCEDTSLSENPLLRCGLALAGANQHFDKNAGGDSQAENGILTGFEASGLNLVGTELVTLSACETGVGEVRNGEGVFGLRRAFQHAGARSILMSLWRVPDQETCELMAEFYRNWLGGQTKKEALRQAELKVLNLCRQRCGAGHPYLWGAFVLVGDPH
jgi:CHAT domain-containing protein/tetratricopeptide (TPR) repeat protein